MLMNTTEMLKRLKSLCEKYAVPCAGDFTESSSKRLAWKRPDGQTVALLPWRQERRFTELKDLASGGTLEGVSTLRFAAMSAEKPLAELLYREFDLCAWLAGSPVASVFAVIAGGKTADVIVKFADHKSASIECSAALPAGSVPIDRHEIIARRGVACDRGVDTQVPQSSIYAFTAAGEKRFTDTDAELFGLAEEKIRYVRAAFDLLRHPESAATLAAADAAAGRAVQAAFESDRTSTLIHL